MLKKLKEKVGTLSIRYLFVIALLLGLAIVVDAIVFIYDIILLGVFLGNEISVGEVGFTLLSLIISLFVFIFLLKLISRKKR